MRVTCNKCGQVYESFNIAEKFGIEFPENVSSMSGCPYCSEKAKYEFEESETYQAERKENELIAKCEKYRIRPEFYHKTLDNFNPETESQKQALAAAKKVVSGDLKKLILFGKNGVGKTHLLNAILYQLGGIRYTAYELFALYRECYSAKPRYRELELLEKLSSEYKCFFVDEVGRTKGSEAELNFMSQFIDDLHTKGKTIVMATNKIRMSECSLFCKDKENCKTCQLNQCIERYFNNDVLSRLSENAEKITVIGRDRRRSN